MVHLLRPSGLSLRLVEITNISLFLCLYRIIQYIITLSSVLLLKLAVVDTLQISANLVFKHDSHKLTGTSSNIDIE